MSSNLQPSFQPGSIHLTRAERELADAGARRCGIDARTWVRNALVHYDRWQDMWDGPASPEESSEGEVELFATLAENAPECLRGKWRLLHDVVRLNEALWVWPRQSVGEFEDGVEPTLPYIDRTALALVWPRLRAVVTDLASDSSATPSLELAT
jgi:hypothetical protein